MNIKVGRKAIEEASQKLSNWGRWGKEDHIGTLNHVTPENIAEAAKLVKTGKVFAMGIPLDRSGPQTGLFRRIWAQGDAGVDVPLTVYRDGKTFELRVPSADRRRFLKAPRLH